MANEIELNDDQLAEVTGGFSIDITKLSATARNSFSQHSNIDGSTRLTVNGGGKNSTTEGLVQGASVNGGNTALGINSISF
jgi:hypothetical protein